jgi:hypothetical protein
MGHFMNNFISTFSLPQEKRRAPHEILMTWWITHKQLRA